MHLSFPTRFIFFFTLARIHELREEREREKKEKEKETEGEGGERIKGAKASPIPSFVHGAAWEFAFLLTSFSLAKEGKHRMPPPPFGVQDSERSYFLFFHSISVIQT